MEFSLGIIGRPTSRIRVAHLRGRKAIMMVQVVNNRIGRKSPWNPATKRHELL